MGELLMLSKQDSGADGGEGTYGILGAFTNRWRDWDFHADPEHGGEIVSSEAHKEYEAWLDKNTQHAPELWIWHTWGTAHKSRADWWAFSGNAFYAHWPLTAGEAEAIKSWLAEEDLAMSFGFYAMGRDWEAGVIDKYRAFEASIVPRKYAANKWTEIDLIDPGSDDEVRSEKMAIRDEKLAALKRLLGDEKANALVKGDEELAAALDAAGFESKAASPAAEELIAPPVPGAQPPPEEAAPAGPPAAETPAETPGISEEAVVGAIKRLEEAVMGDLAAVAETLAELAVRVQQMEQRDEQDRKAAAMPPSLLATYQPRSILDGVAPAARKTETAVVAKSDPLLKQGPAAPEETSPEGWFSSLAADIRKRS